MIRLALLFAILFVAALGLTQGPKTVNLVGTWVADESSAPKGAVSTGIQMTFKKDGTISIKGLNVIAYGTYKVAGAKVSLTITKHNGFKPTNPKTAAGQLTIAEGGKVLLADSGMRKQGKVIMMRLVRNR